MSSSNVRLTGCQGEVIKTRRFGVYISFSHDGKKSQIAGFAPGKAFVNGTQLVLNACKSDQELGLLFPKGLKVQFDCVEMKPDTHTAHERAMNHSDGDGFNFNMKKCAWAISLLWVGSRPQDEDLKNGASFSSQEQSFNKRLESIDKNVFKESPETHDDPEEHWFVKVIQIAKSGLPHPDDAEAFETGLVKEIHLPDGGIVETHSGKRVYFHRSRVFFDTAHLAVTSKLTDHLKVGMEVNVEYVDTAESKKEFFENCPEPLVALVTYTDERPEIPAVIFQKKDDKDEQQQCYVAKIIKFDPAGPTGVEGGVAELVPSHLFVKAAGKKNKRAANPEVKLIRFDRKNMFHACENLANADLQYFFSAGIYAMNIFHCYIKSIEKPTEGGPTHEVTLGWKSNLGNLHSTGQGGLGLPANSPQDQLLYPQIFSFQSTKFFGKEIIDPKTYENMIEGVLPPRSQYFNGNTIEDNDKTFCARVVDIFSPKGSKGQKKHVLSGTAVIESGEHAGDQVFFHREQSSAYGFPLAKADLLNVIEQNEPVFLKLGERPDPADASADSLKKKRSPWKASELWIGWPANKEEPTKLEDIPKEKKYKFLLYLSQHNLTAAAFLKIIDGDNGPERVFIPFRRDENKGTVVHLFREDKGKKRHSGALGGFIRVNEGPLTGQLVTFSRRSVWVLGYNLSNSDLTHIFIEGQKVSLEGVELQNPKTHNEEKVNYWSARVWTSKFIPRNVNKTVPESSHVNNWLKKRNLNYENFKLLVDGKLPPVPEEIATINKSNMLKGGTDTLKIMEEHAGTAGTEKDGTFDSSSPLFKHGAEASRICDLALSITGPKDPKLGKIILNDDNAQMAFHLYKTLETALERYKRITDPDSSSPAKRAKPATPAKQASAKQTSQPKPAAARPKKSPRARSAAAAPANQPAPVVWASDWAASGRTNGNGFSNMQPTYASNYGMPSLMNTGYGQVNANSGYASADVSPWGQGVVTSGSHQFSSYHHGMESKQENTMPAPVPASRAAGGGRGGRGVKRKFDHNNGNGRQAEGGHHARPRGGNIKQPQKRAGGAPRGRGGSAKRGKFNKK